MTLSPTTQVPCVCECGCTQTANLFDGRCALCQAGFHENRNKVKPERQIAFRYTEKEE